MDDQARQFLTTEQVARQLAVTPRAVRRWVADYGLPCIRIGGEGNPRLPFEQERLDAWIAGQNAPESK